MTWSSETSNRNRRMPNKRVNPPVRPVTGLAGARPALFRPAGYAQRWADLAP